MSYQETQVRTRQGFTSTEIRDMTGATYRQIDYWCRQGWVEGQEEGPGSGIPRAFTQAQVDRIREIKEIRDSLTSLWNKTKPGSLHNAP